MEILIIVVLCIAWYAIGITSYIYWWTKNADFTIEELGFAIFIGVFGILMFIAGWIAHNDHLFDENKVLFKKRKKY